MFDGEMRLSIACPKTARITEVAPRRRRSRRSSTESQDSVETACSTASASSSRGLLLQDCSGRSPPPSSAASKRRLTRRRGAPPSILSIPAEEDTTTMTPNRLSHSERVDGTLESLRSLRRNVRNRRRCVEDDRDEARIAVQEVRDMTRHVLESVRAHYYLEDGLNSSVSSFCSLRSSSESFDF